MDMFEFNKIVGAVLATALGLFVVNQVGNMLTEPAALEQPVYVVEAEAAEPEAAKPEVVKPEVVKSEAAKPAQAADEGPVLAALLAAADADAGRKAAKKCAACHSFDKGGKNKVGPNLWAIVGRDKGGAADYAYSAALAGADGSWSFAELDAFLARPKRALPGTKMAFAGIKSAKTRAALILFLRSLSDSPAALPGSG